ncbi:MAG TPA: phage holin family protein [Bryobacteraceae bacterium]|jgi:Flp pilus assembly protein TadB
MTGENNRSVADVLQDIVANIQAIIRSEVRLAKTEITEETTKAGRAAGMIAGGTAAGLFTVWLLLLTILFALSTVIPMWSASLVLVVVMAAITIILLSAGKKRWKTVHPKPEKTIESVKENVEWAKHQAR